MVIYDPAKRLRRCIGSLISEQPFYGHLALRLPLVRDTSRQTVATDGVELRYNPTWVNDTPADQIRAAIAHCVTACALHHHTRRGDRDSRLWNEASREATLPILRDAKLTAEPGGTDEAVERIYARLEDERNQQQEQEQDDDSDQETDGDGQGDGDGGAGGQSEPKDDGDDQQDGEGGQGDPDQPNDEQGEGGQGGDDDHQQAGQGQSGDGDDGSQGDPGQDGGGQGSDTGGDQGGQGGDGQSQQQPSHDPQGRGEVMDAPMPPDPAEADAERRRQEQDWDEARQQAVQASAAVGNEPGRLAEKIHQAHRQTADWRELLRDYMRAVAHDDYSWAVPNRRHIDTGLYLPSLHSHTVEPIALAIDTSGSMDTEALSQVWAEVRELAEELEPEAVTVIQCDRQVTSVENHDPQDMPEELDARGRGGTAYSPVWAELDKLDRPPALVLYFTDLHCHDYGTDPGVPVIWVVQPHGNEQAKVPFGEVVYMPGEDA